MATYYTNPPADCQLCHADFKGVMFDARLPSLFNQWGNVCGHCFVECGGRLGTGWGQKYEKQSDGRWLKVGG